MISKVSDGYMVVDSRNYTITFYSQNFEVSKVVTGYRAMEDHSTYKDGLMAVRAVCQSGGQHLMRTSGF